LKTLICGSIAFDTIMVFEDKFKNHILPDQVHILNVSFLVPAMRREFGGCAGNIGFNLALLGGEPQIMATVGEDFAAYARWMDQQGLDRTHVREVPGTYTAQAFITTDMDDNQITAFHPGAMNDAHLNKVGDSRDSILGIVSPDGREAMVQHAQQFVEAGIPFIFDPGQGLPMFNGDDLRLFIDQADYLVVNDYESQLIQNATGSPVEEIAGEVKAMIVTRGGEGSRIYVDGEVIEIPVAPVSRAIDPTGCGDAYRGGLLYGIANGWDWEKTGKVSALMGAIKVEVAGTQNHQFTREEFQARYRDSFGEEPGDL
jgi:adenosine kinase